MAKSKAKPLSFSTTIRNPERIPKFLKCILPYEGEILTSEIIDKVVRSVIKEKEYTPQYVKRNVVLKEIYYSDEYQYTSNQLDEIIEKSPQKHKEAGFEYGWDSRFDTWYKMIKELGFIKYSMGAPIIVTATGHMLVDAYLEEPCNDKKIQMVFLNALMKYQTNNPLRKNLNENVPLPLLLRVIKYFHEDPEENDAGLARHELPILICWRDNDAYSAYQYIKSIRAEKGFNCSDEFIYEKCLEILENDNRDYLKIEKICHESVDEYIRKMRMTGLLSLRGNGRFLDINSFEAEVVDYVIEKYMTYPKYENAESYIDYMGTIDTRILQIENEIEIDFTDIRKKTLYKYADEMSADYIINELKTVCSKKESKDPILKYINAPTRLEFLTSVALVQNFKGLDVNPNYSVDDEGLPTFTAAGGYADIECFDTDCNSLVEVTLMTSRNQATNEMPAITRHLQEAIKGNPDITLFSILVAPSIHTDTKYMAAFSKHQYNVDILTLTINEFIDSISEHGHIIELSSVQ